MSREVEFDGKKSMAQIGLILAGLVMIIVPFFAIRSDMSSLAVAAISIAALAFGGLLGCVSVFFGAVIPSRVGSGRASDPAPPPAAAPEQKQPEPPPRLE